MTISIIVAIAVSCFAMGVELILWLALQETVFKVLLLFLVVVVVVLAYIFPHILETEYTRRRR